MRYTAAMIAMFAACQVLLPAGGRPAAAQWLQFRGTDNNPVARDEAAPPVEWSAENNVAWKRELPGGAASGPIVVEGRVIVTAATGPRQDRLHVLAFDAADGRPLWHRQFWATGRTLCHPFSSVAANTPASDGRFIYAFFSCNDLVCLDLDGNLRWLRGLTYDYPTAANDVGMASSPVVVGDTVVVQIENEGDSFAAGIDSATGLERWRLPRVQRMNWASPAVLRDPQGKADLVLLQSPDRLTAHDPTTGKIVWTHEAACENIASPVAVGEVVYLPSGGLTALRHPRDSANVEVLWKQNKLSAGPTSPIVHAGRVYTLNRAGVLTAGDAGEGTVLWQLRLTGPFWATPVLAGGRLYCVNHDGLGQVVQLADKDATVLAKNELGEPVLGSPAVVGGALFLRGQKHLWKIAATDP